MGNSSRPLRIACIYRHYWPDVTVYARILKCIAEAMVEDGHSVDVYTAQPGYNDVRQEKLPRKEMIGGVAVKRLRLFPERKRFFLLRLINAVFFMGQAVLFAGFRRYDLILTNAHPPVMVGFANRVIRRLSGASYIIHHQDIHPESAKMGETIKNERLYRFLLRVDKKSASKAFANVVLSEDMADTLAARGVPRERIRVIRNFKLDEFDPAETLPAVFEEQGVFTIFFAGNMGVYQGLDAFIDAARLLQGQGDIRFVFMGEGLAKAGLIERAGDMVDQTVFFVPQQSVEVANACMRRADLGVVSLLRGIYKVAYPSKTMNYLGEGLPLFVVIEPESRLYSEVQESQLGYVVPGPDPERIRDEVLRAFAERSTWDEAGRKALVERGQALFGQDVAIESWRELFAELASARGL